MTIISLTKWTNLLYLTFKRLWKTKPLSISSLKISLLTMISHQNTRILLSRISLWQRCPWNRISLSILSLKGHPLKRYQTARSTELLQINMEECKHKQCQPRCQLCLKKSQLRHQKKPLLELSKRSITLKKS